MKVSLPRPQMNVKVIVDDSLHERLTALDMSSKLLPNVLTGDIKICGAAAFLNHPLQSQNQDRVILHYRTTTRLDMISQRLLEEGVPASVINAPTATHLIIAVFYGAQAFFVFDSKSNISKENIVMVDIVKKITSTVGVRNIYSSLTETEKAKGSLYACSLYSDEGDWTSPMSFYKAVKAYGSLPGLLGSRGERAIPLKVWLYPLKKLDKCSVCAVLNGVSENLKNRAENILIDLRKPIKMCQDMVTNYDNISVTAWFPVLKDKLIHFSELLKEYYTIFQVGITEIVTEEELQRILIYVLERHDQSPFSAEKTNQWL
ncbi:cytolytic toxin-alpha-like [Carassius carassius]|uniref:cytolytic toxin-alpha-like n=1 Tax=Carassius carassius TaxID=217509 RepID=UPI00286966CA|nr:cytolytic toxin-alpha-like [Carassius carassius]